jgi:hypothetical protein
METCFDCNQLWTLALDDKHIDVPVDCHWPAGVVFEYVYEAYKKLREACNKTSSLSKFAVFFSFIESEKNMVEIDDVWIFRNKVESGFYYTTAEVTINRS